MKKHRTTIRLDYATKKLIDMLGDKYHRNMTETIEYAIEMLAVDPKQGLGIFDSHQDILEFYLKNNADPMKEEVKND